MCCLMSCDIQYVPENLLWCDPARPIDHTQGESIPLVHDWKVKCRTISTGMASTSGPCSERQESAHTKASLQFHDLA